MFLCPAMLAGFDCEANCGDRRVRSESVSHAVNPESVSRFRDCLPVPPHVALPAEQKAAAIAVQQYPVGVSRSDSSSPSCAA
jgi:hypothetical protein